MFGKNQLYLKNADVIERMAAINAVVFDKTGTVTHGKDPEVILHGELSRIEASAVKTITGFSTHPLSKLIAKSLNGSGTDYVNDFSEVPGKGIQAIVEGKKYRIGSAQYTGVNAPAIDSTAVFISIDGVSRGFFAIKTSIRENISGMIARLGEKCAALISGDKDGHRQSMRKLFGDRRLLFGQGPQDKLFFGFIG